MGFAISRRRLLSGAALAASPLMFPGRAPGADEKAPPSERLGIGIVGCGAMNTGHARNLVMNGGAQVVAVCDPNARKRKALQKLVEEGYAPQAGLTRYRGCRAYNDFRDLIANKDVDAIWVATPDHWHTLPSLAAVRAGKAVYVEKPMTLTIEEGRVLADEVKRTDGILQCGSQQRSGYGFPRAVELVRNGRIGNLKRIVVTIHKGDRGGPCNEVRVPDWLDYDLWLGQAPLAPYCPERCIGVRSWISIRDYGGGRVASWGSHHLDICQWALDADGGGPIEIEGTGTFPESGLCDHAVTWDVELRYASGVLVHMLNGPLPPSIKFIGDEGWLMVNREEMRAEPASVLDSEIGPDEWHAKTSSDHRQNLLDCIRTREQPVASAEIGHRTATACHLMNICLVLGRKVNWDPARERFVNDPEADAMISRKMRAPWSLSS